MIDRKAALDLVITKFKENKLTSEKTIELIEMIYKRKTTLAEFQGKIRKEIGSIVFPNDSKLTKPTSKRLQKVIAEPKKPVSIGKPQRSQTKAVGYVKGSEIDTWHWCKNCTQYPMYIYQRIFDRPNSDLCTQCKAKEDNKDCTT
jgi:hypothetical protein